MREPFSVIDLFSGPGGLGEGFAPLHKKDGLRCFKIVLSVEKDADAHHTLKLRAFLRKFRGELPDEYYEYLNGSIPEEPDWAILYPQEWKEACEETPRLELGTCAATSLMKEKISAIGDRHKNRTVLVGGPPCQAYSVVGRARNSGNPNYDISRDKRLLLYKEYAKALKLLQPPVAVMENVRGMLSARRDGAPVFDNVMKELRNAGGKGRYKLFSLSPSAETRSWGDEQLDPTDFLVRAEEHGVPQRRHRVFVICIRSDVASELPEKLFPKLDPQEGKVNVNDVIGAMPMLRSRLSRGDDAQSWQVVIKEACGLLESHASLPDMNPSQEKKFRHARKQALKSARGIPLPFRDEVNTIAEDCADSCPASLRNWLCDNNLARLPNNETRGHIREDIARYLYAAVFAKTFARSPRAADFPDSLAPRHANWKSGKFADRFRVQLADHPATTITSHISKDGHYFIHPDPRQGRSLTVREAARLQTFPDNYLFHGGRTQQYVQVGNAVPPYLAMKIAERVAEILLHLDRQTSRSARRYPYISSRIRRLRRNRAIGLSVER